MNKTIAGLLGVIGALVVAMPGHAAPQPPSAGLLMQARQAEMLPRATSALESLQAANEVGEAKVELVQYRDRRRAYRRHRYHGRRYRR